MRSSQFDPIASRVMPMSAPRVSLVPRTFRCGLGFRVNRNQLHAARRTNPRLVRLDLWVHGARVEGGVLVFAIEHRHLRANRKDLVRRALDVLLEARPVSRELRIDTEFVK